MVKIEVDGLWISVPLKAHMTAEEFLQQAAKLERLAGRPAPLSMSLPASTFDDLIQPHAQAKSALTSRSHPSMDARAIADHDRRLAGVIDHLRNQVSRLEHAERRLEQQEAHTQHILEYLQSLDQYIR